MWLYRSTLILVLFVSLKAIALQMVEQPEGCYAAKKHPCAVQVLKRPVPLRWGEVKIYAAKNSSLILDRNNSIKLLEGKIWIDGETYTVNLAYVKMSGKGPLIVENQPDKSVVKNLNAKLNFYGINETLKALSLPGTQMWIGPLSSANQQTQGVAEPIEIRNFLVEARGFGLEKTEVKNNMQEWKNNWQESKQSLVQFYQEVAQRKIASVEEGNRQKVEAEHKRQSENNNLRKLFKNRFYDP